MTFSASSMLAAVVHQMDPFIVRFPDGFPLDGLRWYGFAYVLGFILGYLLLRRLARTGRILLRPVDVGDLTVTVAVGVIVGGRLGYVLFYDRSLLGFLDQPPFWGVLQMNRGGMSFHGGLLGVIAATGWFAWRRAIRWTHIMDLMALVAPLGLFFGRVANYINGELFGRIAQNRDTPWLVKFPQEIPSWIRAGDRADDLAALAPAAEAVGADPAHWTRIVALLDQLGPAFHRGTLNPADQQAYIDAYHAAHRITQQMIAATQAGQQQVVAVMNDVLPARHPSQLYEAITEGALVLVLMLVLWARPRKPLVPGCGFLIAYGLARIFCEIFRKPDDHIGYHFGVLTHGQILSTLMVLAGVILLIWAARRDTQPLGGWRTGPRVLPDEQPNAPNA